MVTTLFKIDLDEFFNTFSFNNKKALFFSTKQFELRSKGGLKIADKSDFAVMIKQIKAIKFLFIGYFYSQLYAKSLVSISKALGSERLSSIIKDMLMSNNSNVYTLAID